MTPEFQAHVVCANDQCPRKGEPMYIGDAKEVTKNIANGDTLTLHFCGDACEQEFYLASMRKTEGQL